MSGAGGGKPPALGAAKLGGLGGAASNPFAKALGSRGIATKQPRKRKPEDDGEGSLGLNSEKKSKVEDEGELPDVDDEMYGNERSGAEKAEAEKEDDQGNLYGIDIAEEENAMMEESKLREIALQAQDRQNIQAKTLQEEKMMFCESDQLREKVNTLCYVQKMASFSPRVLRVIAMACEQRVREIIEKAVIISGHRNDIFKGKLMSVKRGSFDVRRAIRLLEIRDKEQRKQDQMKRKTADGSSEGGDAAAAAGGKSMGLSNDRPMSMAEREDKIRSSNLNNTLAAATGLNEQLLKLMKSRTKADTKSQLQDDKNKDDSGGGVFLPRSKVELGTNFVISIKDVLGVLEGEPQMKKSYLLYKFFAEKP